MLYAALLKGFRRQNRPANGMRSSGYIAILLAATCGTAMANPSPGSGWSEGRLSVLQTLEMVYQIEHAWNDEDSTEVVILYGGPAFVYNYLPDDLSGPGVAVEAGIELRKQFTGHPGGMFAGLYAGTGVQWSSSEDEGDTRTTAVSVGMKVGYRIKLLAGSICLDAEPYLCVASSIPIVETHDLAGAAYIGFKLAFF
jgi:hypothetical protein